MSITNEQIVHNAEIVNKLVKSFPEKRRIALESMFEHLNGEFFTAPASSKVEFHGCFAGGLADHSLRVVQQLRKIANALQPGKFANETLDFVGLCHDLGKVGDIGVPLYVQNPSDWHRDKGMLYIINPKLNFMPTEDRTMFLLQKFGVDMTEDEYTAIRISDGQYVEANKRYAMRENDLSLLLHMADRWACQIEKHS